MDEQGRIIICKSGLTTPRRPPGRDRFVRARGRATVKWRTDELMRLRELARIHELAINPVIYAELSVAFVCYPLSSII